MTSEQSDREQVPNVTGSLVQMIVCVRDEYVSEWVKEKWSDGEKTCQEEPLGCMTDR